MRLVCGGYEVVMAGEMVGRERERDVSWKNGREVFFCQLYTRFSTLLGHEIHLYL
jgi:hypothetical protein